mmetsp:Transcript_23121/g.38042  ORF Transcript_23121/g.38042 Transcript_23121/m.38042 type:complete len:109 (+) Transcript_23121:89-415(+)
MYVRHGVWFARYFLSHSLEAKQNVDLFLDAAEGVQSQICSNLLRRHCVVQEWWGTMQQGPNHNIEVTRAGSGSEVTATTSRTMLAADSEKDKMTQGTGLLCVVRSWKV